MTAKTAQSPFNIPELKISYRPRVKASDLPQILDSESAYEIFRNHWDIDTLEYQEQLYIMLLNYGNRLIGISKVASGGMTQVGGDAKIIFGIALKSGASYMILAHNHPSGEIIAGPADIAFTNKMRQAAKVLDMAVVDHLIIAKDSYTSLADEGLMD